MTHPTPHRARILCISKDPDLLRTRWMVLQSCYETVSAAGIDEIERLTDVSFDVIVLCHTLTPKDCDLAVSIARGRWPEAKVVALTVERSSCEDFADRIVRGLDGPDLLLETIDHLMPAQR